MATLFVLFACTAGVATSHIAGDRDGLTMTADVSATSESIIVNAVIRNGRDAGAYLVPDQCGRVIDAELGRTIFEPEGSIWRGSIGAAKALVLQRQRSDQGPDSFHPRRVDDASSNVPECRRPDGATRLAPGATIAERWELPLSSAYALAAVGSDGTRITLEAVEARDPGELEYLDVLTDDREDKARVGRSLRAQLPASAVLSREPIGPATGPSKGELFDRLLADKSLRSWIETQPADGWALAELQPARPDMGREWADVRLRLLNTAYERAARVEARPDGSAPVVTLPGEASRTRAFERRPGTLPPGVSLVHEPDTYTMTDDLLLGDIALPSGRVVVGEYLFDLEPLPLVVPPGRYPIHATLARYRDQPFESVSNVTLVLSDAPTGDWAYAGDISVDGGTTTIVSPEGRDLMRAAFDEDSSVWLQQGEDIFDSVIAHDWLATEYDLTPELDLAMVTSGNGDGGYPVWIGSDATGSPTRVVVDFYLLHLDWPGA